MLARLAQEQGRGDLVGIGVDEYTALCIDGDGIGRVFSGNGGHVWLVGPQPAATVYAAGKPLSLRAVPVRGVGSDSLLHLADFRIERPAFSALYDVEAGRLIRRDANPAPTAAP
jgi:cyanophycinase-like exopeptidase